MRISATGISNHKNGFTLVEIIVVLLIIGIVLGLATITIDTRSDKLDLEARRMAALFKLAGDEAVMSAREYAVDFREDSYRFMEFVTEEGKGVWREIDPRQEDMLTSRQMPEGITLRLFINREEVSLTRFELEEEERENPIGIYLFSSGEVTPFEVVLTDMYTKNSFTVSNLNPAGEIRIVREEEAS